MRKTDTMLKEYAGKLSTENLKFLFERLTTRGSGDLAEALNFMSNHGEIDKWFKSAHSSDGLYDMVDLTEEYVEREYRKRIPEVVVAK